MGRWKEGARVCVCVCVCVCMCVYMCVCVCPGVAWMQVEAA